MRNILLLSNIILTFLAVILTVVLLRSKPQSTLLPSNEAVEAKDRTMVKRGKDIKSPRLDQDMRQRDLIWEANLFHPARNFEDSQPNEIKISDEDQVKEHFELISIAQVSDRSCASIRVITENKNPRGTQSRPATNRNSRRRNTRETKPEKDQKVYQLRDPVGETGFVLNEIGIDYVILIKGDQEIKLSLDKSDEASEQRREVAYKSETEKAAKLEKERMEAEKRNEQMRQRRDKKDNQNDKGDTTPAEETDKRAGAENPSPPPPPPGAVNPAKPNAPSTSLNPNDETSVRQQLIQRLKEQRERRRQQLEEERSKR